MGRNIEIKNIANYLLQESVMKCKVKSGKQKVYYSFLSFAYAIHFESAFFCVLLTKLFVANESLFFGILPKRIT